METLPAWFASVREWRVPRGGGWLCRWDCGDGEQQFGVDAWISPTDSIEPARLKAAEALGAALREHGLAGVNLQALPSMAH